MIKGAPKGRVVFALAASACLTFVTVYVIQRFVPLVIENSVTLEAVYYSFIESVGYGNIQRLTDSGVASVLYFGFVVSIFGSYSYVFYRREKQRQYKKMAADIAEEVGYIAEGNFDHQIAVRKNDEFGRLAKNVNDIVAKLKMAMAEERRTEQAKNDLITNVSHDLRTPLTSIVGYLTLIEQDNYRDEIELRYYTQVAYEKALRLNDLVDDLFEYTRYQNKGVKLQKVPLNMAEMLGQLTVQYRLQLAEVGMVCREKIADELLTVLGDGEKLARVFENLISNAIKYGREGKYVDIHAFAENGMVVVDVVSYGEAISSIDLPYIFERFYRVEKSRAEERGGSGLGLAIAKSIVELHSGTIDAYSDEEKTIFTVKLPKAEGSVG